MRIDSNEIEKLIFRKFQDNARFTQDSPIYPDVWLEYLKIDDFEKDRVDLILTPHRKFTAADLFKIVSERLHAETIPENPWELATTGESVAAKLTFRELLTIVLPLSEWCKDIFNTDPITGKPTAGFIWLEELVGAILYARGEEDPEAEKISDMTARFRKYFENSEYGKLLITERYERYPLYSVSKNRVAGLAIQRSVPATKADAGRRVFDIDATDINWAVLDTGIDARHPAFFRLDKKTKLPLKAAMGAKTDRLSNNSRVVATYDFTKFRKCLVQACSSKIPTELITGDNADASLSETDANNLMVEAAKDLRAGRLLDWSVISPLLRIPHNAEEYIAPKHSHGTHVAGILGACHTDDKTDLQGMCPCISLYDIRVMDDRGVGDEFNILAALQFVRWMNSQRDGIIIHGINLSLSMFHEVASFGCGQTPVCNACDRLVAEGCVVVAAAGNLGQTMFLSKDGMSEQGFRMLNITDPGNAEGVITVGSTHNNKPHTYGVSYFSSKGPTGDGRMKPDLVAPGEKITSTCIDGSTEVRDGTSMAAPHVSGAAALLLAKNREMIGNPKRVKEILCRNATDLGREKYFQGAGMIDVLRAIQSI